MIIPIISVYSIFKESSIVNIDKSSSLLPITFNSIIWAIVRGSWLKSADTADKEPSSFKIYKSEI